MIAVVSIKTVDTGGDPCCRIEPPHELGVYPCDGKIAQRDCNTELIYARQFIDKNGKEYEIGWSEAVQKEIGIPFEAFQNMSNEIRNLYNANLILNRDLTKKIIEVNSFKRMSFWQRIKYCFRGAI